MFKNFIIIVSSLFLSFSLTSFKTIKSTKLDLNKTVLVSLNDYDSLTKEEESYSFLKELYFNVGFNYEIIEEYSSISNIIKLKINEDYFDLISSFSSVNYIQEDYLYSYDDDDVDYSIYNENRKILTTNYSSLAMNNTSTKLGEGVLISILDSAFNPDHDSFNDLSSSVDKKYSKSDVESLFENNSFKAKGLNYVNSKLIFTYDYSMDDVDVKAESTHGGHVASIATSNGEYKGIAPNSQVALMKVFNDKEGGCTSSIYIKALEDAYLLKSDIISISFGTYLNSSLTGEDKAVEEVMSKLKNEGTIINVASGNDGREFSLGSNYEYQPLSNTETKETSYLTESSNVNSIGSSSLEEDESNVFAKVDGKSIEIYDRARSSYGTSDEGNTYTLSEFKNKRLFYEYVNNNKTYEYVVIPNWGSDEDYDGLNVNNKIVVIARGELYFSEKIYYAYKHNASGIIIYNSNSEHKISGFSYLIDDEVLSRCSDIPYVVKNNVKYFDTSILNIPIALVDIDAGNLLVNATSKKLSFFTKAISSSSSGGATSSLELKPDLVAPGENIYGAITYFNNSYQKNLYGYKSGTSMSTPNASGAYASIISELKDKYSNEVIDKLVKSHTTILKDEYDEIISPRYQGNGLINIEKTLSSSFYLTYNNKSKVELKNNNDIASGNINFNFDINKLDDSLTTYKVNIKVLAPKISSLEVDGYEYEVKNREDTLLIEKELGEISLNKNSSFNVNLTLKDSIKSYLDKFTNGTYLEGYVEVISSNNETSTIPFLGYYGDYSSSVYEEYSFLKNNDELYESDLAKDYIYTHYGDEPFVGSYILKGGDEDLYLSRLTSTRQMNLDFDILDGEKDGDDINVYTGKIEDEQSLIIQFFMLKNAQSGSLVLYDENNNVILTKSIADYLPTLTTELLRSYILNQSSALLSSKLYLHQSYVSIPLYDINNNLLFESNKNYRIVLNFKLFSNDSYLETINLKYDQEYISYPKIEFISEEDNFLKFYIKEEDIISITSNTKDNISFSSEEYGNNTYTTFTLNLSNLVDEYFLEIKNSSNTITGFKYFKDHDFIISGPEIYEDLTIETNQVDATYYFSLSEDIFNKSNFVCLRADSSSLINDSLKELEFKSTENFIYFTLKDNYLTVLDPINYKNIDYTFLIPIIVTPVMVLIALTISILIIKKHKKHKKNI